MKKFSDYLKDAEVVSESNEDWLPLMWERAVKSLRKNGFRINKINTNGVLDVKYRGQKVGITLGDENTYMDLNVYVKTEFDHDNVFSELKKFMDMVADYH
jgi:acetolactate synthase regulatory subunit